MCVILLLIRDIFEEASNKVIRMYRMLYAVCFYFRGVSFDSFDVTFPYKYNFAACYEEV